MKVKNKDGVEKEIIGQKLIVYNTVDGWGESHTARITQPDGVIRIYPGWFTYAEIHTCVNGIFTTVTDTGRRVRELVKDGIFEARKLSHSRRLFRICGQKAW